MGAKCCKTDKQEEERLRRAILLQQTSSTLLDRYASLSPQHPGTRPQSSVSTTQQEYSTRSPTPGIRRTQSTQIPQDYYRPHSSQSDYNFRSSSNTIYPLNISEIRGNESTLPRNLSRSPSAPPRKSRKLTGSSGFFEDFSTSSYQQVSSSSNPPTHESLPLDAPPATPPRRRRKDSSASERSSKRISEVPDLPPTPPVREVSTKRKIKTMTLIERDTAPGFVRNLTDVAVKVGTRTRLLAEINPNTKDQDEVMKVSWFRNDQKITFPTDGTTRIRQTSEGRFHYLDISPVLTDDEGKWICLAENFHGRTSSTCFVKVMVPKSYRPPEFVESLKAVLTEAGTVSLECKVIGTPTPLLKWYKDGVEIKAGDIFALRGDASSLGVYTCEATNCMGSVTSSSRVHMNDQSTSPLPGSIQITSSLLDSRVRVGEKVEFQVQINKQFDETLKVNWYNKSVLIPASERVQQITNSSVCACTINPVEVQDDGEWTCEIVSATNEKVRVTNSCVLSILIPRNYRKPKFLEDLKAILTEEGLVSFECKVCGFPTPILHWYKDGYELKPGDVYQLSGANSLGRYSCVAHNCMGDAESSTELTLEDIQHQLSDDERKQLIAEGIASKRPPKFVKGLKSVEVKIGDPCELQVQLNDPKSTVSWFRDSVCVDTEERYVLRNEGGGVHTLLIQELEFDDQAEWKCTGTNEYGHSVSTAGLKLIIPSTYKKPKFLESLRAVLSEEGTVNLECKVIGVPVPVLKWYKDGVELKAGDIHRIISGADGTCCLGTYTCVAKNCMGEVSSSAALLGFEDKLEKDAQQQKADAQRAAANLTRDPSLSTIMEERTSQMLSVYETPASLVPRSIEEEDRALAGAADISVSIDGKDVSVSLYETPDLTENDAKQIIEMFANEYSEYISEHNVVPLPSLRFVKETSTSGNIVMEAVLIDVTEDPFDTAKSASMGGAVIREDPTEADYDDEFSDSFESPMELSATSDPPERGLRSRTSSLREKRKHSEQSLSRRSSEKKRRSEERAQQQNSAAERGSQAKEDATSVYLSANSDNEMDVKRATPKSEIDAMSERLEALEEFEKLMSQKIAMGELLQPYEVQENIPLSNIETLKMDDEQLRNVPEYSPMVGLDLGVHEQQQQQVLYETYESFGTPQSMKKEMGELGFAQHHEALQQFGADPFSNVGEFEQQLESLKQAEANIFGGERFVGIEMAEMVLEGADTFSDVDSIPATIAMEQMQSSEGVLASDVVEAWEQSVREDVVEEKTAAGIVAARKKKAQLEALESQQTLQGVQMLEAEHSRLLEGAKAQSATVEEKTVRKKHSIGTGQALSMEEYKCEVQTQKKSEQATMQMQMEEEIWVKAEEGQITAGESKQLGEKEAGAKQSGDQQIKKSDLKTTEESQKIAQVKVEQLKTSQKAEITIESEEQAQQQEALQGKGARKDSKGGQEGKQVDEVRQKSDSTKKASEEESKVQIDDVKQAGLKKADEAKAEQGEKRRESTTQQDAQQKSKQEEVTQKQPTVAKNAEEENKKVNEAKKADETKKQQAEEVGKKADVATAKVEETKKKQEDEGTKAEDAIQKQMEGEKKQVDAKRKESVDTTQAEDKFKEEEEKKKAEAKKKVDDKQPEAKKTEEDEKKQVDSKKKAEDEKKQAETKKKEEEDNKKKADEEKKQTEAKKKEEETKKQAENKKKEEEETKKKAEEEKKRADTKVKDEEERKLAEAKKKEEEEKKQAEAKKKEEEEKKKAEARKKEEEEKKQADAKKKEEEENKKKAEEDKKQAESKKKEEEEKKQAEAKKKEEEEKKQAEAKKKEEEEKKKAEARKKEEEEKKQAEAKKKEEEEKKKAEAKKKEEEEKKKAEAKKKEEEEKKKAEARKKEEEEKKQVDAKRKEEEEKTKAEAKKKEEEEKKKKAEEEKKQAEAKKKEEEEKKQAEAKKKEEEEKKKAEAKKKEDEEKKQAESKKKEEEEKKQTEAKKKEEEEKKKKAEEEKKQTEAKKKEEEEKKKTEAKKKEEEEKKQSDVKKKEEEEKKKKAEEDTKKKAEEEKKKAEEEAKKAEEEKKKKAEEDKKKEAEEKKKKKAEEEAKKTEEEKKKKAEEAAKKAEAEKQKKAEEEAKKKAEEEKKKKAEEEAIKKVEEEKKKKAEEEAKKKAEEEAKKVEEEKKKKAEEEANKKVEEEKKKKAEVEAIKKAEEEAKKSQEEKKKKAEEEAKKAEEEKKKKAEEEAKKAEEEAKKAEEEKKKKSEEEAKKKKEDEEKKKKAEEEKKIADSKKKEEDEKKKAEEAKTKAEEEKKKKAEEEATKKAEEEKKKKAEEAKTKAEEEKKKKAEEEATKKIEEEKKKMAEEEAKKKAEDEKKKKAEEEAKKKAEDEKKKKAEEEATKKVEEEKKAEEEAKKKAEEEKKKKAEEEAKKKAEDEKKKAEEEDKKKAEDEKKKNAEEEAKKKAEDEKKKKAEEEAKKKAEDEKKKKAEEEAKKKAEEEKKKKTEEEAKKKAEEEKKLADSKKKDEDEKKKAEEEAKKKAEDEKKAKVPEEAKKKADEETKKKVDADAKKAEEDKKATEERKKSDAGKKVEEPKKTETDPKKVEDSKNSEEEKKKEEATKSTDAESKKADGKKQEDSNTKDGQDEGKKAAEPDSKRSSLEDNKLKIKTVKKVNKIELQSLKLDGDIKVQTDAPSTPTAKKPTSPTDKDAQAKQDEATARKDSLTEAAKRKASVTETKKVEEVKLEGKKTAETKGSGTNTPDRKDSIKEPASKTPDRKDSVKEPATKTPDRKDSTKEPAAKTPDRKDSVKEPTAKTPDRKDSTKESAAKTPDRKDSAKESSVKTPDKKDSVKEPAGKTPDRKDSTPSTKTPDRKDSTSAERKDSTPSGKSSERKDSATALKTPDRKDSTTPKAAESKESSTKTADKKDSVKKDAVKKGSVKEETNTEAKVTTTKVSSKDETPGKESSTGSPEPVVSKPPRDKKRDSVKSPEKEQVVRKTQVAETQESSSFVRHTEGISRESRTSEKDNFSKRGGQSQPTSAPEGFTSTVSVRSSTVDNKQDYKSTDRVSTTADRGITTSYDRGTAPTTTGDKLTTTFDKTATTYDRGTSSHERLASSSYDRLVTTYELDRASSPSLPRALDALSALDTRPRTPHLHDQADITYKYNKRSHEMQPSYRLSERAKSWDHLPGYSHGQDTYSADRGVVVCGGPTIRPASYIPSITRTLPRDYESHQERSKLRSLEDLSLMEQTHQFSRELRQQQVKAMQRKWKTTDEDSLAELDELPSHECVSPPPAVPPRYKRRNNYQIKVSSEAEDIYGRDIVEKPTFQMPSYFTTPSVGYSYFSMASLSSSGSFASLDEAHRLRRPRFSMKLSNRTTSENTEVVKFACTVFGTPDPTIQWYKNGLPIFSDRQKYVITTNCGVCTLDVHDLDSHDTGEYTCFARNFYGKAASSAILKVESISEHRKTLLPELTHGSVSYDKCIPVNFTTGIMETNFPEVNELVLECQVKGNPKPEIMWMKNGQSIISYGQTTYGRFRADYANIFETGKCRLIIQRPRESDSGVYTCVGRNYDHSAVGRKLHWSDEITKCVNVKGGNTSPKGLGSMIMNPNFEYQSPRFISELEPFKHVHVGREIVLTVEVAGVPNPEVRWFHHKNSIYPIKPTSHVRVVNESPGNHTLYIPETDPFDFGTYTVRVSNKYGMVESSCCITEVVQGINDSPTLSGLSKRKSFDLQNVPPMFTREPRENILLKYGDELVIECEVEGWPQVTVNLYRGCRNVILQPRAYKELNPPVAASSADTHQKVKFTLTNLHCTDFGMYTVEAKNIVGMAKAFVNVKVLDPEGGLRTARSMTPSSRRASPSSSSHYLYSGSTSNLRSLDTFLATTRSISTRSLLHHTTYRPSSSYRKLSCSSHVLAREY